MDANKVYKWLENSGRWWWPPYCQLCGATPPAADALCAACAAELPFNIHACRVCALPLERPGICGRCQRRPPPFHRTLAAFRYQQPIAQMVHGLKFGQRLYFGRILGEYLADCIEAGGAPLPDLVIPVPLHRRRLAERGYNQAAELARPLARRLHIELALNVVERRWATAEQSTLNALQRRRNVKDAFTVTTALAGCRVAIVDDVMTTGATVTELARSLVSAGAACIEVWLCARAPLVR